ncbi:ATP-binding cassette domain-containing protein [Escherichia coli]|uniref:ATP-binding cassette domain-containing protein n=1 Tax=Escherichia coli TaxID=562 RepID=UPI00044C79EB|nr:ATP-binding cassette domain-containing protein [Escherichia coli]EEX2388570.1 ATP-binding cassette domain-containing protein [Escherichia coli]EFK1744396.1 ATP-binding cassette domain-containing protein [Escherichia coli]EIL7487690.1 ATP-binding cassette domain-containing protein [Escherichia coli]EZG65774.1 hypothetical protein BX78_25865 [Escherichia coli O26:H11 str. 2010C-4819]
MINVQNVSKTFILHQQNGVRLPVLQRASLTVNAGECVVLHGHSGSGKSTFSGGEQQRVNIARGFIVDYPILLLDEPTASLDAKNSAAVVELIREAKTRGAAIVGIFHDEAVRNDVADRLHPMGASA